MYTCFEAECVVNVYTCNYFCFFQKCLVLSFEITFEMEKKHPTSISCQELRLVCGGEICLFTAWAM